MISSSDMGSSLGRQFKMVWTDGAEVKS